MFADYAFDRLIEKGYSPQAAAAVVGAFQQESGMDLDPLAVHDNGTGMGIAGWRDEKPGVGRKTNLLNWAKENDLDPNDIDTQIDFFDHEVTNGDERNAGDALRNAQTIDDATNAMVHYERPQGYDSNDVTKANGYSNRLANAQSLFNTYTGNDPLAQDVPDTTSSADDDLDPVPEVDEQDEQDYADAQDEKPTTRERVGEALLNVGRKMQSQNDEPLDYTPAGDNVEVDNSYDTGIPLNAYQQYTSLYADGGVVGENDIHEFFKMIGV